MLERKADVLSLLDDWSKNIFEAEDKAAFYTSNMGISFLGNFKLGENPYRQGALEDLAIKESNLEALKNLLIKAKKSLNKYSKIYILTHSKEEVEKAKSLSLELS